jgi:diguanylate cyclase (GGDEF)-like protein/PAS domain S-box-containing protein
VSILRRDLRTFALAVLAVAAGMFLVIPGWLEPSRPIEFSVLMLASVLIAAASAQHPAAERRGTMTPSYVLELCVLLLFGPVPAVLASGASALVKGELGDPARDGKRNGPFFEAVAVMAAMQAAGLTNTALGGTRGHFVWPMQAIPIVGTAIVFGLLKAASAQVVAPLIDRRKIEPAWPRRVLRQVPAYIVGAAIAVGLAEIIDHRAWEILPVVALPLLFAYRAFCHTIGGLEEVHRRQEVIDGLHAMSAIDGGGRIVLWNDALERVLNCRRDHALGLTLARALPSLKTTALPGAVTDTLKDRTERIVSVPLARGAETVLLEVKIVPVDDGVTLLWQDMTSRLQSEQALQRATDRLVLAADGANDGWWEWDVRGESLNVSTRWKVMLGLSPTAEIARLDDWTSRVHQDDAAAFLDALQAHLQGRTERLQHEHRIRHEDGTYRWFMCSGVRAAGRRPSRIAGSLSDVTDRLAAQEQLRSAAFLDPLTGLRNRADFVDRVGRRLAELGRRTNRGRFAVLYLDLDRFKFVNDSLGHLVGDELLIAVSRRLESCLRADDCLGRLGGDEFAILLDTVHDDSQANAIAFRIQDVLKPSISTGGREVFTSASIGIAVSHPDYNSPDEIMRDADTAMYVAKSQGKACHKLFDAEMHARTRDRLSLESDLRRAVEALDFEVHYQPIVLLASGVCVGFESLVRWTRNGEKISPAIFIPIAEELGLIEPIGTWVLQQACYQFAEWKRRFPAAGLDCISVNASSRQLTQPNYPYLVEQAIQSAHLAPADLRIEVTETALMDAPNVAARVLSELRDLGVKIYLDDFGTGCSSLSHLHTLPMDALKVDRSFVTSLLLPERPPIVESILALARTLKTSVVAEGIEYEMQARELERLGCTHAQGYLFSRPLSSDAVEEMLLANLPLGPKRARDPRADVHATFATLGAAEPLRVQ